jgi:hypothetical protein
MIADYNMVQRLQKSSREIPLFAADLKPESEVLKPFPEKNYVRDPIA